MILLKLFVLNLKEHIDADELLDGNLTARIFLIALLCAREAPSFLVSPNVIKELL